jgi:HEAT repeat protein
MRNLSLAVMASAVLLGCAKTQPTILHGKPANEWIQALQSADAKARKKAAEKLGSAGAVDPAIVPALAAAVKDKDAEVRLAAVTALLKTGPEAREAMPVLEEARNDKDSRVRDLAAKALTKIQALPK